MAFLFSELVQYNQTRVNSITDLEQRLANQWMHRLASLRSWDGQRMCVSHTTSANTAGSKRRGMASGRACWRFSYQGKRRERERGPACGVGSPVGHTPVPTSLTPLAQANKREIRLQGMLQFIHTNVWRCLFGKARPPSLAAPDSSSVCCFQSSDSPPARRPDRIQRPQNPEPQPADSLEIVKEDEYIIGDKDLLVNRRGRPPPLNSVGAAGLCTGRPPPRA